MASRIDMALIPVQHRVTRFWPAFFGGVFLFCAFAVLVVFIFRQSISTEGVDAERARLRAEKLTALRKEDQSRLDGYKWIDKTKGSVQIPIDRAMELVAGELNRQKPGPSEQRVENPYPMGLADAPPPVAAPSVSGTAATPPLPAVTAPAPAPAASAAPAVSGSSAALLSRPLPVPASTAPAATPPFQAASPKPSAKPRAVLWDWSSPAAPAHNAAATPSPGQTSTPAPSASPELKK